MIDFDVIFTQEHKKYMKIYHDLLFFQITGNSWWVKHALSHIENLRDYIYQKTNQEFYITFRWNITNSLLLAYYTKQLPIITTIDEYPPIIHSLDSNIIALLDVRNEKFLFPHSNLWKTNSVFILSHVSWRDGTDWIKKSLK